MIVRLYERLSVFLASVIQHAMRHIVICGHSGSAAFFHIISQMTWFSGGKKSYSTQNLCFDCLYKCCLKHFSLYGEMSEIRLDVKYALFLSDCNETNFPRRSSKNSEMLWISIEWEPSCCTRTDVAFPISLVCKSTTYNTHTNFTQIT
jgi:hypothetical protein